MGAFYARHVCRIDPMPKEVTDSFAELEEFGAFAPAETASPKLRPRASRARVVMAHFLVGYSYNYVRWEKRCPQTADSSRLDARSDDGRE